MTRKKKSPFRSFILAASFLASLQFWCHTQFNQTLVGCWFVCAANRRDHKLSSTTVWCERRVACCPQFPNRLPTINVVCHELMQFMLHLESILER